MIFPSGTYAMAGPMKITRADGRNAVGAGPGNLLGSDRYNDESVTRFVHDKPGPFLLLDGADHATIADLRIEGSHDLSVGIEMRSEVGWPTTGTRVENVTLSGMAVGIEAGAEGQPNNDLSSVDRLGLLDCDVGVLIGGAQSLGWSFRDLSAVNVGTLIHAERGGSVHVEGLWATAVNTLLRVDDCGPVTSQFSIRNAHVEVKPATGSKRGLAPGEKASPLFQLGSCAEVLFASSSVVRLNWQHLSAMEFAAIDEAARLTVDGVSQNGPSVFRVGENTASGKIPELVIRGGRWSHRPQVIVYRGRATLTGLTDPDGNTFPDCTLVSDNGEKVTNDTIVDESGPGGGPK